METDRKQRRRDPTHRHKGNGNNACVGTSGHVLGATYSCGSVSVVCSKDLSWWWGAGELALGWQWLTGFLEAAAIDRYRGPAPGKFRKASQFDVRAGAKPF